MKWLLDTNAVSRHLGGKCLRITARIKATPPGHLYLCSIVKAKMLYGAWNSPDPIRSLAKLDQIFEDLPSLPFEDSAADAFVKIQAFLSQRGTRIGPHDTMIAAIALANDFTLITNNTREFSRVPNLKIEDWQS